MPRHRPIRWQWALAVSLVVHGLVVLGLVHLPGQAQRLAGKVDQASPGPSADDEIESIAYLVSARPPKRAPVARPAGVQLFPAHTTGPAAPVPAPAALEHSPGGSPIATTGAGQPEKGTTTFFQVRARGNSVAYVIDHSASMGRHGALETARRELLASLEQLPATARFQVLVYNRCVEPLLADQPRWLPATALNRERVARALAHLAAEGSTLHDQALPPALALGPDVVFFLTDADELSPQCVRAITQANHGRSVIHVIELTTTAGNRPDMPLKTLALANGGCYRAVALPADGE